MSSQQKRCNSCGATNASVFPYQRSATDNPLDMCVACAAEQNTFDTAGEVLRHALQGTVTRWAEHWKQHGLTGQQMSELLDNAAHFLGESLKDTPGTAQHGTYDPDGKACRNMDVHQEEESR